MTQVPSPESNPHQPAPPARGTYWSRAGLIEGARAMLPLAPGMIAFSLSFGAVAAQKGFSLADTLLMTMTVYAGMAQMVGVQSWPEAITWSAALSLALVTATINTRFILMGASLRPWLGALPPWQSYPLLTLTTDGGWLLALRYHAQGGNDASFFLGGGILAYIVWVAATIPGYLASTLTSHPERFGVDLVMPAFFIAMLVPAWRGARRAIPWLAAGAVAVVIEYLFHGWWFILGGAIAGSVVGGLMNDSE